jgi:hypothetical protein
MISPPFPGCHVLTIDPRLQPSDRSIERSAAMTLSDAGRYYALDTMLNRVRTSSRRATRQTQVLVRDNPYFPARSIVSRRFG